MNQAHIGVQEVDHRYSSYTQVCQQATEMHSVASLAEVCLRLRGEERPTMKEVEMTLQTMWLKRFKLSQVAAKKL